jgi:hypothetical protein
VTDLILGVLIYSLWIGFVGGFIVVWILRFLVLFQAKVSRKEFLIGMFIPGSIGLYALHLPKTRLSSYYNVAVVIQFVLIVLGSLWVVYTHFM